MAIENASEQYKGVAMITGVPFDKAGKVNVEEYQRLIERQINAGISIIQCPLADELYYLSDEELLLVMKTHVMSTKGKVLSCAIASHALSTDRIIENAKRYEALGFDIIKLLSPLHFALDFTPEDIYNYYASVIKEIKKPIMIYNQPRRSGVNVPPDIIARLAEDYRQVGIIEETNFTQAADVKSKLGNAISIFVKFPFWLSGGAIGCEGFYSWLPYAPEAVQELYSLCATGKHDEAKEMFYQRYALYSLQNLGPFATVMKYCLSEAGFSVGGVRKPAPSSLPSHTKQLIRETLKKFGLLAS
jgi:4-hydroxy-tetrahydrodipicolinate synthase